ncbi:hypothetical protein ABZ990_09240 [Streptomyces sp. NPDC046203]|uniref:hypothetical protein n=1 Tax=Streptomyces sp. NPDC046203 TaxID=3154602 RepID=UPI0033E430B5
MSSAPRLRTLHRPLVWFTVSMAAFALVCLGGLFLDDRELAGAPIWAKPLKFALSFVAYCLTLAWMLSLLPGTRARRAGWWAGTVLTVACAGEMALITTQVIRGRQSHFNVATPFDAALFGAMGGTVVILWLAALVIAALLLRARILDRATAWAVRLSSLIALAGAALGFVMTRPTSGQLARKDPSLIGAHSVGVPDGGPGLPLIGWSTTGGDLRVGHFFGMHALQLIPLLLLVLSALAPRFTRLADDRIRLRLVLVASGCYAAVFALLTWQALRGRPLLSPDGTTLAVGGAITVATALGTALALRVRQPRAGSPNSRIRETRPV